MANILTISIIGESGDEIFNIYYHWSGTLVDALWEIDEISKALDVTPYERISESQFREALKKLPIRIELKQSISLSQIDWLDKHFNFLYGTNESPANRKLGLLGVLPEYMDDYRESLDLSADIFLKDGTFCILHADDFPESIACPELIDYTEPVPLGEAGVIRARVVEARAELFGN